MSIRPCNAACISALSALLLGACVNQGELVGPPYEVVALDRVPGEPAAEADAPAFALQRRRLDSIEDFAELSSPAFRIRQGGTLITDAFRGDTVSSGSFEGSHAPELRYVVEGGAAVPRDYATLMMFSAAVQFERVLSELRSVIDPTTRAALDAHGVLDAIFEPAQLIRGKGTSVSLRLRTNAFFLLGLAYVPLTPRLFLRPGVRLGYLGITQGPSSFGAQIEERGLQGLAELGISYDAWLVPALVVGTGANYRSIDFIGRGIVDDSDAIDHGEWLGMLYAQAGLGFPLFQGLLVVEPYARLQHTFSDERAPFQWGIDLSVAL